jgi:hypothetical protein
LLSVTGREDLSVGLRPTDGQLETDVEAFPMRPPAKNGSPVIALIIKICFLSGGQGQAMAKPWPGHGWDMAGPWPGHDPAWLGHGRAMARPWP